MQNALWDRMGDWNPQFLRELNGRWKLPGILLGMATSLVVQGLVLIGFYGKLPESTNGSLAYYVPTNRYCTGAPQYVGVRDCLRDEFGDFIVNWPLWWFEVFDTLSLSGLFTLAVVGVYAIINDLHREEKLGTLNFIRLSPTSARTILTGKMLGVPILLYWIVGLALPIHGWAALSAGVPVYLLMLFYGVMLVGIHLIYSLAALFSLATPWLNGMRTWIGSGTILLTLILMITLTNVDGVLRFWLILLRPTVLTQYLFRAAQINIPDMPDFQWYPMTDRLNGYIPFELQWFNLPIGLTAVGIAAFMIFNYSIWNYWTWRGLERCFRTSNSTLLSKRQSYGLVFSLEVIWLGFLVSASYDNAPREKMYDLHGLLIFNLLVFVLLVAVLSPDRQAIYDWARFRRQGRRTRSIWRVALIQDLIWAEKSPAIVAIALNLGIILAMMIPLAFHQLTQQNMLTPAQILAGFGFTIMLMLIYGAIAQLAFMMKTPHRRIWGVGVVLAGIILPIIAIPVTSVTIHAYPAAVPWWWLFSLFPWHFLYSYSAMVTVRTLLWVGFAQFSLLSVVSMALIRQLHKAGESETQAFLRAPLA